MKKNILGKIIIIGLVFFMLGLSPNIKGEDPQPTNWLGKIYMMMEEHEEYCKCEWQIEIEDGKWYPGGTWEIDVEILYEHCYEVWEIIDGEWSAGVQSPDDEWEDSREDIEYTGDPPNDVVYTTDITIKASKNPVNIYFTAHLFFEVHYLGGPWHHTTSLEDPQVRTSRFYKAKVQDQSLIFNELTNTQTGSPRTIDFTSSASNGTTPYGYYWDFGDEENSFQQNPTHTYDDIGTYTVSVNVTDDAGFWTLAEKEITVT